MLANNEYVIETFGLSKSFGEVEAVRDLNLNIPNNAIVGFLGPNGSGKSTTIKLLLGLLKASRGSGKIFGLDIDQDSLSIRRRIGYLAQQPRFYEEMTSRQILRFTAGLFFSGPQSEIETRIQNVLELVGLEDKADRRIQGFSGGERQRLGLAQAQINDPELLILDEPAASLDPMGRRDVLAIMERLRKHTTIFYSTHILDDVQRVSDWVIILNHGQLISQGPIETLLNGKGGVIYSLSLEGQLKSLQHHLARLPWVSDLHSQQVNGIAHWRIAVNDEQIAKKLLLRTILEESQVNVLEFKRQTFELEEVFMDLIEGKKS